jgi:diaminohydroxyphosphoribosylaminopyrimidine deaminase/5-amino-6-(5-phosphoribosylamino)uracil reductase
MSSSAAESDQTFMRRAIRLAMNGRGLVEPNPMVGCVIVKDGRVIGEGYHQRHGGPHAEPNALAACTESSEGATAYVTLEPCCHSNKKTPPCVPALIAAKLARVVIGCLDPNPQVNGKGAAMLREAGVRVDGPVLEATCKQLVAPFIARVVHGRPYVTLKWAESANRQVAGSMGKPVRITNAASDRVVHQFRTRSDAILIGSQTVVRDDPLLTVRGVPVVRQPVRVVLDTRLRTPVNSQIVTSARELKVLIYCADEALSARGEAAAALRAQGVELSAVSPGDLGQLSLPDVLSDLARRGVTHLLVEPGPTLARSFLDRNLADRVWVFRSPVAIPIDEGFAAPAAPAVAYAAVATLDLAGDRLSEHLNPKSTAFFSAEPSADLVLTRDAV